MRLLLDTHAFFWWLIDEARLSPKAHEAIKAKDSEVFVSIASAWEMAIKVGLGKWTVWCLTLWVRHRLLRPRLGV